MTPPATKTTAAKLQIKDGYTVRLIGGEGTATLLGPLPTGARVAGDDTTTADAAILFAADKAELDQHLDTTLDDLVTAKAIWVCYPKGNKTDINRDTIFPSVQNVGWKIVSNVSIDNTWSALRIKPV